MKYSYNLPQMEEAYFVKRINRFVAQVRLKNHENILVHTPNTGSLKGLLIPNSKVLIFDSKNKKRKYPYSWKCIEVKGDWKEKSCDQKVWVSIDTLLPNKMVYELIAGGFIKGLDEKYQLQQEVTVEKGTRLDLKLISQQGVAFAEVKNVTLVRGGVAYFPDAVTSRGLKHINFLKKARQEGHRAIIFFTIQRHDAQMFAPAWDIDQKYSQALLEAHKHGVEIFPLLFRVTPKNIVFEKVIPYDLTLRYN